MKKVITLLLITTIAVSTLLAKGYSDENLNRRNSNTELSQVENEFKRQGKNYNDNQEKLYQNRNNQSQMISDRKNRKQNQSECVNPEECELNNNQYRKQNQSDCINPEDCELRNSKNRNNQSRKSSKRGRK